MTKRIAALELNLTAEEEAAAERIYDAIKDQAQQQLKNMARLMASKKPEEMLGRSEFELRDMALALGAGVLETSINQSAKKRGLFVS